MTTTPERTKTVRFLAESVEYVPIDAIEPHPANPNEGDVGAIAESMDALGTDDEAVFYSTIFVQRSSGRIVAGEHRWRTLRDAGSDVAPVVYLDVDDAQALRILVADNEIPRRTSRPDDGRLAAILTDLHQQTPQGLLGTGFDGDSLDSLLADLAAAAAPSSEPTRTSELLARAEVTLADPQHQCRAGDVWTLDHHVLYVADVMTDWPTWVASLTEGTLFVPYPGPYVALSVKAAQVPCVFVQPDTFVAGHILDKYVVMHGKDSVAKIKRARS